MKALLRALFSRGFFAFLGLVAFAVVVWFWGYLLAFGDYKPLETERARLILIGVVFVVWLARLIYRRMRSESRGSALYDALIGFVNDPRRRGNVLANTEMGAKFRDALEAIRRQHGARFFESVPIHVLIGPPAVGKTKALEHSGLLSPIQGDDRFRGRGFEIEDPFGTKDCDWFISSEGILLDTAGRLMTQSVNPEQDADDWRSLLTLLKGNRRHPINGVIVAFSIADLLEQSAEERRGVALLARQRIDELQVSLKVTLPVYVMITKADMIPGFTAFFEDLDPEALQQVWGTTFDYDAAAARPSESGVEELPRRLDELAARIERRLAKRLYDEAHAGYRGLIMQFSREVWELGDVISELAADVFSSHSKDVRDPVFRGLYFTSGMQDGSYVGGYLQSLERAAGIQSRGTPVVEEEGDGKSFLRARPLPQGGLPGGRDRQRGPATCRCDRLDPPAGLRIHRRRDRRCRGHPLDELHHQQGLSRRGRGGTRQLRRGRRGQCRVPWRAGDQAAAAGGAGRRRARRRSDARAGPTRPTGTTVRIPATAARTRRPATSRCRCTCSSCSTRATGSAPGCGAPIDRRSPIDCSRS